MLEGNSNGRATKARSTTRTTTTPPPRGDRRHSDSPQAVAEALDNGALPRLAYRLGETAAQLGISRWTLDTWIADGVIGVVKVKSLRLVPKSEVDRLLTQGFERQRASS